LDALISPEIHRISAWDGLTLHVREWANREWPGEWGKSGVDRPPLLCLPGIVRTGGDFETLVPLIAGGRRAIAVDYMGRGDSGRTRDTRRYGPEACVRDVLDVAAALHIRGAVVIGTSFGGLLAMGLRSARPSLVRAVVMNDIGPDIGQDGASFVRDFVAHDPALESVEACIAFLQDRLPPLSLDTDAAWRRMVELTYRRGEDGRFHPLWDIRLADRFGDKTPDLWALWRGLADIPLLLVHATESTILLPETVARMRTERPDMTVVTLPGIGHAPVLTEPDAVMALQSFLDRCI
jgi:pimeloyl-ACP methyl ester carboxylesterase